jgi:hypothetical protein
VEGVFDLRLDFTIFISFHFVCLCDLVKDLVTDRGKGPPRIFFGQTVPMPPWVVGSKVRRRLALANAPVASM